MNWRVAAQTVDVPEGEALSVVVEGKEIALYNLDGTFYATGDICTHARANLADGFVEGDCVECPLHEGVFHIPTGEPRSGPVSKPIPVYPIKVEAGSIFVAVPAECEAAKS